ncbi:hypothetical protein QMZ92_01660 [Streptomyces sp. HNM0645]|uniref:NPCBM/NEW2 domain-containing protein n=1 Tax=Streptomyces sp. HNM0645 TaxID=2782343 RepID=UPI0024B811A8|nr:NPCBM/NEW2 domain-containing protein [Streptomyces sp. HNM0645]MDI9883138.1 hypothetical protein [Streptomyces sp. HNM0645]
MFRFETDGEVRWTSPETTGASATVPGAGDATGARYVRPKAIDTDGSKSVDHADWPASRFRCG